MTEFLLTVWIIGAFIYATKVADEYFKTWGDWKTIVVFAINFVFMPVVAALRELDWLDDNDWF